MHIENLRHGRLKRPVMTKKRTQDKRREEKRREEK
jgi:hypothetical protein